MTSSLAIRELLALDGPYKSLHDRQHGVELDEFINPGEDFTPAGGKRQNS